MGVKKGTETNYSKCDTKFSDKWGRAEERAGAVVRTTEDDETVVQSFIAVCSDVIAEALTGRGLPSCLSWTSFGGVEYGGMCWFLAEGSGEDCDTICANAGMSCNLVAIRDFSGLGGYAGKLCGRCRSAGPGWGAARGDGSRHGNHLQQLNPGPRHWMWRAP